MKNGLIGRIRDSAIYQELARAGRILSHSPKHRYTTLASALFLAGTVACGDPHKPNPTMGFSQSASLIGATGINHNVNLEGLASATIEYRHNGTLTGTRTINGPTYSESTSSNLKGEYCFTLKAEGVQPKTSCVTVPDYEPNMNVVFPFLYSNDTVTANLENIVDPNDEDNPVSVTGAVNLDDRVQTTLNGNSLRMISGQTLGPYSVGINTRTATGVANQIVVGSSVRPDQIAFAAKEANNEENIYLINLDGTGVQRLTNVGPQNIRPSWSPDGRRIAFQSIRNNIAGVVIIDANGGNERRLIPPPLVTLNPSWSPNGYQIVFTYTDFSTKSGIGRVNASDGSGFTSLYEEPYSGNLPRNPNFSPDGTKIAFEDFFPYGNYEIVLMDANGTNRVNFTNNPAVDQQAKWLPNGFGLVFTSNRVTGQLGEYDLYRQLSSGNLTRLTNTLGAELDPEISLDGRTIIFSGSSPSQFHTINSDGAGLIVTLDIPGNPKLVRFPAWRPRVRN